MREKIGLLCGLSALILSIFVGGCDIMNTTAPLPKIEYPTRSINVIVPFSGGGGLDLQARSMEKVAYKYLGQAFVVQNKAGAGGVVGWNELAVSAPDGYTLGISSTDLLFHSFYPMANRV